jgi:hypothetical protein
MTRRAGPCSRLDLSTFSGKTREGAFLRGVRAELVKHVGGHPSERQAALIGRGLAFSIFPGASVISQTIRVVIVSPSASSLAWTTVAIREPGRAAAGHSGPEEFSSPSRDVIVQLECRARRPSNRLTGTSTAPTRRNRPELGQPSTPTNTTATTPMACYGRRRRLPSTTTG